MRTIGNAIGIALILLGVLWLLQEYNFIPGSFLSDDFTFAHRGLISICAGFFVMITTAKSTVKRS
ncbi:MAG: hypothetical protein ABSD67_08180 [Terracidiphilus sp.]|jgi:hypothetical protein